MSVALAVLLASAPASLPTCSWDRPGHNPFTGDVVEAVDRYTDIPAPVRQRLQQRMMARSYDEIVTIRRDAIEGKARYGSDIRGMHFGSGQVCGTVSRARWADGATERGLVYCEDGHCILVPTVCRNVSRITRTSPAIAEAPMVPPLQVMGFMGQRPDGGVVLAGPPLVEVPVGMPGAPQIAAAPAAGPVLPLASPTAAAPLVGEGAAAAPGAAVSSIGLGAAPPATSFGALAAPGAALGLGLASGLQGDNTALPILRETIASSGSSSSTTTTASPVPEPTVWLMLGAGLGLLRWRRHQQAR